MHLGGQQGFTLIEVMMAAFVLVVGILGVVTLVDRANGALGESNARVGATNLARELVEYTRSFDYDDVTTGRLPALLHQKTGVSGTENPWKVVRRNVEYTVTVKSCLFDDPADGLSATTFSTGDADRPLCTRPAAINPKVDSNPDDFRRVVIDLDWKYRGAKAQHVTQDALIVNPSGGLGPRITAFPPPAGQITAADAPSGQLVFNGVGANTSLTTTPARAVHWNVSGANGGDAVGVGGGSVLPTAWKITWDLGVPTDASYVYDGSYTINAQAFNDLGVPGNLWANPVLINRFDPLTPRDFVAGRNPQQGPNVVDLLWSGNEETDIIGYRVVRVEPDGSKTPICPNTAGGVTDRSTTSCLDMNAPASGEVDYELVAVDRPVITDPSSGTREGEPAKSTAPVAETAPETPTGLTVDTFEGLPRLQWVQPPGEEVAFYRIYRDGTAVEDRYKTTVTIDTQWIDSDPGPAPNPGHSYYVAAVGKSLSESPLSAEGSWNP